MIHITDKAVAKIKEISEAEGIGHCRVRLRVVGGGCAGLSFDLYFEENVSDLDENIEIDNISIIVDPLSFQYLDGASVDYEIKGFSEGFTFNHPDISKKCGCGNSFSY